MTKKKAEPTEENASTEETASTEVRDKDFVELLTEKLSWQTIRDVMTYDVNRPLRKKTTGDLADLALQRNWITREQYDQLRSSEEDVTESLGQSMMERGLITPEQLTKAKAVMERTGQPLWRTLLQLKMTLPADVVQFLKSDIELPFGKRPRPVLCRYLVDEGICSEEQLDAAWHEAKAQKIEFDETGLFDVVLVVLRDDVLVGGEAGHVVVERALADHHARGVHAGVAGQAFQLHRILPEFLIRRR